MNKALILGRITTDLEVKKIGENETPLVNFSVATNKKYKNKEGNQVDEAEFHDCVAFGNLANIIGNYASKGQRVHIEGEIKTKKYEDNSGNNRYRTQIVVQNIELLDKPSGNGNGNGNGEEASSESGDNTNQTENEEELPF